MISFALNVVALMLGTSAITLQTNDGQTFVGTLVQLDEQQAAVKNDDGIQNVSVDQVLRISNADVRSSAGEPTITVTLTDGTQIGANSFELADKAKVGIVGGVILELDPRNLRSVRFQKPSVIGPLDKQWNEFTTGEHEGDLLIVRKGGDSLSYLEGMVRDVTKQEVDFVFDGDDFQVAREKIEGLNFLTRQVDPVRADRIVYVLGTCTLKAKGVQWTENGLNVDLVCGDKIRLPMSVVPMIDFGASKIVYLSALEPDKLTVTPRLPMVALSDLSNRLIYKPGVNKSLSGRRLRLPSGNAREPSQYFDYGLAIHSRTKLVYHLDEGEFGRLQGIAGLNPDLKQKGSVRLSIEGDGQMLLEEYLGPHDPPLTIDVDVAGVRRLSILVDYGDKLDAADHLNLCEIRLTP